nr:TraR/DksA C4-type zinc finger protein [Trabulsiella odontotermitis]
MTKAGIDRAREMLTRPGSAWCEDCGAVIPAARRSCLPGAVTCVDCQSGREASARHRRPTG